MHFLESVIWTFEISNQKNGLFGSRDMNKCEFICILASSNDQVIDIELPTSHIDTLISVHGWTWLRLTNMWKWLSLIEFVGKLDGSWKIRSKVHVIKQPAIKSWFCTFAFLSLFSSGVPEKENFYIDIRSLAFELYNDSHTHTFTFWDVFHV